MWASPDNIRLLLGYAENELTNEEIEQFIKFEEPLIVSELGYCFVEWFKYYRSSYPDKVFNLRHRPLVKFEEVRVNNSVMSSDDYSVDLDRGVLRVSKDLMDGCVVEVRYIPKIFVRFEELSVALKILLTKTFQTGSDVVSAKVEQLKSEIESLKRGINTAVVLGWADNNRNFYKRW